jgi:hypothetical protein
MYLSRRVTECRRGSYVKKLSLQESMIAILEKPSPNHKKVMKFVRKFKVPTLYDLCLLKKFEPLCECDSIALEKRVENIRKYFKIISTLDLIFWKKIVLDGINKSDYKKNMRIELNEYINVLKYKKCSIVLNLFHKH